MLFISAWGVTLCLYIFSPLVTPSMRPETWPLIFFVLVFLLLFFPAPIFYYRTRFWLLRRLVRLQVLICQSISFKTRESRSEHWPNGFKLNHRITITSLSPHNSSGS